MRSRDVLHRLTRGPAGEEGDVAGAAGAPAHVAVVEGEEVEALASFPQVHDPRLRLLRLKPKLREECPERGKRAPGLRLRPAHHHEIVGVADKDTVPARLPVAVEPVQVDVAEQGRDDPALRRAADLAPHRSLLHDPGTQERAQELEDVAVDDPLLHRLHQPLVRDRLEAIGDVRFDQPAPAPEHSSRISCRPSCAVRLGRKPKEHGWKSASKIGSITVFAAACTIRSRTVGIDSGRRSCEAASG